MDGAVHGFTCIRKLTLLGSLHHQTLYSAGFTSVMGTGSVEPNEAAHISRFFYMCPARHLTILSVPL